MISYTAKRSLVAGHVANTIYQLDIDIMDAEPDMRDVSAVERSAGGAMEVAFERQDVYWTIRLAPVNGPKVAHLIEFLDSIESGETFSVWLRDTDVAPLVLKMDGEAGSLDAFMRCGARDLDFFTAQFTALQAVPYDTTGGGSGGGGFAGGDAAPIDVWSGSSSGLLGGDPPAVGAVLLMHFDNVHAPRDSATPPNTVTDGGFDGPSYSTFGKFGGNSLGGSLENSGWGTGWWEIEEPTFDLDESTLWSIDCWVALAGGGSAMGPHMIVGSGGDPGVAAWFGLAQLSGAFYPCCQWHEEEDEPAITLIAPDPMPTDLEFRHMAVCRSNDVVRLFVDGVMVASATVAATDWHVPGLALRIGDKSSNYQYNLDELRIVTGAAPFTSNFTPPTEPYPDPS